VSVGKASRYQSAQRVADEQRLRRGEIGRREHGLAGGARLQHLGSQDTGEQSARERWGGERAAVAEVGEQRRDRAFAGLAGAVEENDLVGLRLRELGAGMVVGRPASRLVAQQRITRIEPRRPRDTQRPDGAFGERLELLGRDDGGAVARKLQADAQRAVPAVQPVEFVLDAAQVEGEAERAG